MFTALVGIVALIVAGCTAFFSVQGLATLYAARYVAVCIDGTLANTFITA